MKNIKPKIKIVSEIIFAVSILCLVVGFFIQDIPENPVYSYIDNKIITYSWHDHYENIIAGIALIMIFSTAIEAVMLIAVKIKNQEKILGNVIFVLAVLVFSLAAIEFSNLLVVGLWSRDDYSPQCYEFTDGRHTIVIEEESFLLYGGGTIYQIKDGNEAIVIGTIGTDDGARNHGNYEIKWLENSAQITYNTYTSKDHKVVETVNFE